MELNDWLQQNIHALRSEVQGKAVDHPVIRRALAYVVDYVCLGIVIGGGAITLMTLEKFDDYWIAHNCAGVVFTLVYFTLGASNYWGGMTLGKRFFKINVVHEDGNAIGIGRALLRSVPLALLTNAFNIVRMVEVVCANHTLTKLTSVLLILLLAGTLYFALLKLNRQGLHDLLASTHVVRTGAVLQIKKQLTWQLVVGYLVLVVVVLIIAFGW